MTVNQIPNTTVTKFVNDMSQLYTAVINGGWPLSMVPAPFVIGPPGIGKSEGIYQLAEKIEQNTGKKVIVTDIRLSMFSPIDLRGVPVSDAQREFTVWLKPKIFALDESPDVINLVLFDELNSAPQQVQVTAYQITLDKRIGEHRLPDNCIIIGAGNRIIDKSVVFRMPNALANRMQHYEIQVDFPSWKEWAVKQQVHPYVLGYLSYDSSKLCQVEVPAEQTAFPSPRTWMFVSNMLRIMERIKPVSEMYMQIGACIGTETARDFLTWCQHHGKLPDVENIFKGRRTTYPASSDALYALVSAMIRYIENREQRGTFGGMQGEVSVTELENMAVYAARFPSDYQACLYHSLEQMDNLTERLKKVKIYREFKRRNS